MTTTGVSRSSGFLNVAAARTGAPTSGKPPSDRACCWSLPAPPPRSHSFRLQQTLSSVLKRTEHLTFVQHPAGNTEGPTRNKPPSLTPLARPQIQTSSRVGWTPEQCASSPTPSRGLSQDTNLCLHFSNNITRQDFCFPQWNDIKLTVQYL